MLTPEERGPLAWWAYDSRDRLGLSDREVAAAIPGPRRGEQYDPATIRKAETNDRHMSRPLWKRLTTHYTEVAREKGIALDPVPTVEETERPAGGQAELIVALEAQASQISALVSELQAEREERQRWERGWITTLRAALAGQVPEELLDALVPQRPGDALQ